MLRKEEMLSNVDPALYISAVLSSIDEEKDPRNLMITYDLVFFILKLYGSNTENK